MPEMIKKTIATTVKAVEGKGRVLEFVGSTEVADRDGEVIKASAWNVDRYLKNPVVQWAHRYDEPPIGRTLSLRQDSGKTIFEIEFADAETYPFADTIFRLCKGGFLSATSVGFMPLEYTNGKKESEPRRTFTSVELLELSIVPVPSNPEALAIARSQGLISVKEFEAVTKTRKKATQGEIKDEIEYLTLLIEESGLNEETRQLADNLIKRITGGDTPEQHTAAVTVNGEQLAAKIATETDKGLLLEYLRTELKRQLGGK